MCNLKQKIKKLFEWIESVNPDLINKKIFTNDEIEKFRDNFIKELKKQGIDKKNDFLDKNGNNN